MKPLVFALGFVVCGLALGAVCPETPGGLLFDLTGPTCSPSATIIPCQCSEMMEWDPAPGAEWYVIRRTQGAVVSIVGNTKWRNRDFRLDEDGNPVPAFIATQWAYAWDCLRLDSGCFFPQNGYSYDYDVLACRRNPIDGTDLCADSWSNKVTHITPDYYCYDNGTLVPCF